MSYTILLLASMASAVLLASGVAWAANIKGTGGDDVLTGTTSRDVIIPFDGNDKVYADPPCMQIHRILPKVETMMSAIVSATTRSMAAQAMTH
jgi:hypothetical protein